MAQTTRTRASRMRASRRLAVARAAPQAPPDPREICARCMTRSGGRTCKVRCNDEFVNRTGPRTRGSPRVLTSPLDCCLAASSPLAFLSPALDDA
eukprot:1672955-Pleurochrysis_carterae.AAC.5